MHSRLLFALVLCLSWASTWARRPFFFTGTTSRIAGETCPVVDNCSFYQCAEKNNQCGPKGYLLDYGFKSCSAFIDNTPSFSSAGQVWVARTRKCLQEAVYSMAQAPTSCEILGNIASDSHSRCYKESGICNLPPHDLARIFAVLKGAFFSHSWGPIFSQAFKAIHSCGQEKLKQVRVVLQSKAKCAVLNRLNALTSVFASRFNGQVPFDDLQVTVVDSLTERMIDNSDCMPKEASASFSDMVASFGQALRTLTIGQNNNKKLEDDVFVDVAIVSPTSDQSAEALAELLAHSLKTDPHLFVPSLGDLSVVDAAVCVDQCPISNRSPDDPSSLSSNTGAIIGISIGCVLVVIVAAMIFQYRKKRFPFRGLVSPAPSPYANNSRRLVSIHATPPSENMQINYVALPPNDGSAL